MSFLLLICFFFSLYYFPFPSLSFLFLFISLYFFTIPFISFLFLLFLYFSFYVLFLIFLYFSLYNFLFPDMSFLFPNMSFLYLILLYFSLYDFPLPHTSFLFLLDMEIKCLGTLTSFKTFLKNIVIFVLYSVPYCMYCVVQCSSLYCSFLQFTVMLFNIQKCTVLVYCTVYYTLFTV